MKGQAEEPSFAAADDVFAGDLLSAAIFANKQYAPATFGDEHLSVREERDIPRYLEVLCDNRHCRYLIAILFWRWKWLYRALRGKEKEYPDTCRRKNKYED